MLLLRTASHTLVHTAGAHCLPRTILLLILLLILPRAILLLTLMDSFPLRTGGQPAEFCLMSYRPRPDDEGDTGVAYRICGTACLTSR